MSVVSMSKLYYIQMGISGFERDARMAHHYLLTEEEYALIINELKPPDPFRLAVLNFYREIARGVLK
jgi:hypothetical protein